MTPDLANDIGDLVVLALVAWLIFFSAWLWGK